MDQSIAVAWIEARASLTGPVELVHERPWSTVLRAPVAGGAVWFKACSRTQAFEPRLTADLFGRWPDCVPEVLGHDERRGWLLLADAGTRIGDLGNLPTYWLDVLPSYAEVQRGEAAHATVHSAHGVPDLRVATLADRYEELLSRDLPLAPAARDTLVSFAPAFRRLCGELASGGLPDTIQHDDLHMNNVYLHHGRLRVLDWGDSSISHPFASLVPTLRFLEQRNGLAEDDPQIVRIRDAYLEPWGRGLTELFDLAMRIGRFAHAIAALRQRAALSVADRMRFDEDLRVRLERALARVPA